MTNLKEVRYRWVEGAEYLIPIELIEEFDVYLDMIEDYPIKFNDWEKFNTLFDFYMIDTDISQIKLFIELN